MTITQQTVEHVAKLARLSLTPEEVERYTQDLAQILGLIEQLNQLDLSGVDTDLSVETLAAQPSAEQPVYREDVPIRAFTREQLLANAPEVEDGCFRVPRILDSLS